MLNKYKLFLYKFDLIGINPHLYVFNQRSYNSIISSIISFLILLFSIIFVIYSFVKYLKFDNPSISYTKDNEQYTERKINLKDILMFQVFDTKSFKTLNKSDISFEAELIVSYFNGTTLNIPLDSEICELGKNIDINVGFRNITEDLEKIPRKLNEFNCLSAKHDNLSIFFDSKKGYSSLNIYPVLEKNSLYKPEYIQSLIITEINLLNHNIKKKPINQYYTFQFTNNFDSEEYTRNIYNFQFIKYESDEGIFFINSKIFNGITFSDMTFYKYHYNLEENLKNYNKSRIGQISFELNKSHFDHYVRTYQKFQSLLAEIMSVISLLLEIGRQIGFILLDKKMSENIIRFAFYKDKNKKEKRLNQSNINIDKLFSNNKKNEISDKKTNLDLDKSIFEYNTEKNNLSYNFNLQNNNIVFEKIKIENKNNKILKKINYLDIIKSYICIKNKRSKLINYCHNIITKYLSVEKIVKKFNKMYILYSSLASNETYEDLKFKNKKLKAINKYISEIKSVIKKINNINSNF